MTSPATLCYGNDMREELEDAAIDCRMLTFPNATAFQLGQIKRLAHEVATQFRRVVSVEVSGPDVIVSYALPAA